MAEKPYWLEQLQARLASAQKLASTVDLSLVEANDVVILGEQARLMEYLCGQLQPIPEDMLDDPAIGGEHDVVITKLILELKKAQQAQLVAESALAKSQQMLKEVQARDAGNARKAGQLAGQLGTWKLYAQRLEASMQQANITLAKFKQPLVPIPVPPEIALGTAVVKDGHRLMPANGGPYIPGTGPAYAGPAYVPKKHTTATPVPEPDTTITCAGGENSGGN
jgi:hypothetical protein